MRVTWHVKPSEYLRLSKLSRPLVHWLQLYSNHLVNPITVNCDNFYLTMACEPVGRWQLVDRSPETRTSLPALWSRDVSRDLETHLSTATPLETIIDSRIMLLETQLLQPGVLGLVYKESTSRCSTAHCSRLNNGSLTQERDWSYDRRNSKTPRDDDHYHFLTTPFDTPILYYVFLLYWL